jgi:hypothetical protein
MLTLPSSPKTSPCMHSLILFYTKCSPPLIPTLHQHNKTVILCKIGFIIMPGCMTAPLLEFGPRLICTCKSGAGRCPYITQPLSPSSFPNIPLSYQEYTPFHSCPCSCSCKSGTEGILSGYILDIKVFPFFRRLQLLGYSGPNQIMGPTPQNLKGQHRDINCVPMLFCLPR